MQVSLTPSQSLWSSLLSHSSRIVGTLAVGLAAIALPAMAAPVSQSATPSPATATPATLPDGVYLYGQSSQPDQIGQGYFVFEVNRGSVVGALYMPRSSFDCASGSFQNEQLALKVVNSYDRSTNPFEIALEQNYNVASSENPALQKVGLQGFHPLAAVSENDQRMLSTCKADLQKQAHK